jgi:hypothetical protein
MMLQIVCAFTLFGLLQGLSSSVKELISNSHRNRLYVNSSVGEGDPLPISMRERIQPIPGVQVVNERAMFGGTYQKPNEFVPVMGTRAEDFFRVLDEIRPSKNAIAEIKTKRSGALAGRAIMEKYGWKSEIASCCKARYRSGTGRVTGLSTSSAVSRFPSGRRMRASSSPITST